MIDKLHLLPPVLLLAVLLGSSTASAGQTPGQGRSPFLGSVAAGHAASETLPLSLKEAFDRALAYNLGVTESDKNAQAARAVRLRSLSALLPDVSARVSGTREQINLRALGFNLSLPGVNVPTMAGPFGVADARVYLSQQIFNWSDIQSWRSAAESERASRQSYRSDRDLVVLTTGNAYLVVTSDHATVDSIRAQVTTAKALYDRAVDRNKAGVIAAIDVLRTQVELQTQQQRLIAADNQRSSRPTRHVPTTSAVERRFGRPNSPGSLPRRRTIHRSRRRRITATSGVRASPGRMGPSVSPSY